MPQTKNNYSDQQTPADISRQLREERMRKPPSSYGDESQSIIDIRQNNQREFSQTSNDTETDRRPEQEQPRDAVESLRSRILSQRQSAAERAKVRPEKPNPVKIFFRFLLRQCWYWMIPTYSITFAGVFLYWVGYFFVGSKYFSRPGTEWAEKFLPPGTSDRDLEKASLGIYFGEIIVTAFLLLIWIFFGSLILSFIVSIGGILSCDDYTYYTFFGRYLGGFLQTLCTLVGKILLFFTGK